MPRSCKNGAKKSKGRKVTSNLKNRAKSLKKTLKKKKMIRTECVQVKEMWDKEKTTKQNMTEMGLVYKMDEALPLKQAFRLGIDQVPIEMASVADVKTIGSVKKQNAKASKVLKGLEDEAKQLEESQKGRKPYLLDRDMQFCIYMMERHGENYKAMARDPKNLFQDTPKQIQKKIRIYKESPYFKALESMET